MDSDRFRFLYRQGDGAIDRRQFWLASWPVLAIAIALTLIWLAIMPRQARDLSRENLVDWRVVATFAYLMVYVFALFICAIAEYFVSAKRFADRGRTQALAGLAPFALFVAAAAHWYRPRSEGTMPEWLAWMFDAVALGILIWTIAELGFCQGKREKATG